MNKLLSLILLPVLSISAMSTGLTKIEDSSLLASQRLGKVALHHKQDGFYVEQNNKMHKINHYDVSPELRKITPEQLAKFRKVGGYLHLKQMSNGDYSVEAKTRGLGGGPIAGAVAYFITKSFCYGTAGAAVAGVVVGTGGAALATGGAATAVLSSGVMGAAGGAAAIGATAVAGAIATSAGAVAEATLLTAAVVNGAGSLAATVAAVETASTAAAAFFGALPFLP